MYLSNDGDVIGGGTFLEMGLLGPKINTFASYEMLIKIPHKGEFQLAFLPVA